MFSDTSLHLASWRLLNVTCIQLCQFSTSIVPREQLVPSSLLLYIEWFSLSASSKRYRKPASCNRWREPNLQGTKLQHCRLRQLLCSGTEILLVIGEKLVSDIFLSWLFFFFSFAGAWMVNYTRLYESTNFENNVTRENWFSNRGKFTFPCDPVTPITTV